MKNEETEFETKENKKELHKAQKKAKIISIDREADEVKEASMQTHNGGDGNVKEKKEKKKKHKDKKRDGVDRVSSLNEIIKDNKVDELIRGQICNNNCDDHPKMDVEEGGSQKKKKRKREKEGDIVEKNDMTNGQKLAKERNHSDGKIREEVKLALMEKKLDRIVEDNKHGEVAEQNCHESGDIAENNEEERGTSNDDGEDYEEVDLRGKRFSQEEDEMIMEVVNKYIDEHCLGDNRLDMVLHCRKHPEVRGCWEQIAAALPWRTGESLLLIIDTHDEQSPIKLPFGSYIHYIHIYVCFIMYEEELESEHTKKNSRTKFHVDFHSKNTYTVIRKIFSLCDFFSIPIEIALH